MLNFIVRAALLFALCALLVLPLAAKEIRTPAHEAREPPAAPEKKETLKLPTKTSKGTITQWGDVFRVEGIEDDENGCWNGFGHIRPDGKIVIIWTFSLDDGDCISRIGVYRIGVYPCGAAAIFLEGNLGTLGEVTLGPDGSLTGSLWYDPIYPRSAGTPDACEDECCPP